MSYDEFWYYEFKLATLYLSYRYKYVIVFCIGYVMNKVNK